MEEYLKIQGISMDEVYVDGSGNIFIQIEGVDHFGHDFNKDINLPEEYQTEENRNAVVKHRCDLEEETQAKLIADAEDKERVENQSLNED